MSLTRKYNKNIIKLEIIFPQTYSGDFLWQKLQIFGSFWALCGFWPVPLGPVLLHLQISEVLGEFYVKFFGSGQFGACTKQAGTK